MIDGYIISRSLATVSVSDVTLMVGVTDVIMSMNVTNVNHKEIESQKKTETVNKTREAEGIFL